MSVDKFYTITYTVADEVNVNIIVLPDKSFYGINEEGNLLFGKLYINDRIQCCIMNYEGDYIREYSGYKVNSHYVVKMDNNIYTGVQVKERVLTEEEEDNEFNNAINYIRQFDRRSIDYKLSWYR
jgi:hypothetical protein